MRGEAGVCDQRVKWRHEGQIITYLLNGAMCGTGWCRRSQTSGSKGCSAGTNGKSSHFYSTEPCAAPVGAGAAKRLVPKGAAQARTANPHIFTQHSPALHPLVPAQPSVWYQRVQCRHERQIITFLLNVAMRCTCWYRRSQTSGTNGCSAGTNGKSSHFYST